MINNISSFFKNDNSFVKDCVFITSKADTPLYLGPSFSQNTVKWRGYSGIFQYTYLLKGYGVEVSTGLKKTILVPIRAFSGWYRNCKYSVAIGSLIAYKVAYKGPFFITKPFTRYGYMKYDPLSIFFYNSAEIPLFRVFYKAVKLFKKASRFSFIGELSFKHYFTKSLAFARFFSPKYTPLTATYHFMVELQLLRTGGTRYSQQFSDDYYLPSMSWIRFPLDPYLTLRETSSNLLFSGKHVFRTHNSIMAYWLDIYLRPAIYFFTETLFFKFFSRLLVLRKSNLDTTYVKHALSGFNVFHSFFFNFNDCYNMVHSADSVTRFFFFINLLTLIILKSTLLRRSLFFLFSIILHLLIDLLYGSFYQKLIFDFSVLNLYHTFNFGFLFRALTVLFFRYFKLFFAKGNTRSNFIFSQDTIFFTNLKSASSSFIKTAIFFTIIKLNSFVFLFSNFFINNSYNLTESCGISTNFFYLFKLNHKFLKYVEYLPKFLPLYIRTESKYFLLEKIKFKEKDILLSTRTNSKFFSSANFNLVDPTINEMDKEISSDIFQRFFLTSKSWLKRRFYNKIYKTGRKDFKKPFLRPNYPFTIWDPFRKLKFFKKYKPRIRPFTRTHLHINKMRLFRYKKLKFRKRTIKGLGYYKKLKFYRRRLRRKTLFLFRGIWGLESKSNSWKEEDLVSQKEYFFEFLKKKKSIHCFKKLDEVPSLKNYLDFVLYYFNKGISCSYTYQIFSQKLAALTTSINATTQVTNFANESFLGNTFLNTLKDRDLNSNFLFKNNIFSNRLLRFFNGVSLEFYTKKSNSIFLTSSLNFTSKLMSLTLFRSFLRRKNSESHYVDRFADIKFQKWFHSWINEVHLVPKGVFLPKTTPTEALLKKKFIFKKKRNLLGRILKKNVPKSSVRELIDNCKVGAFTPKKKKYKKKKFFFFLRNNFPDFRAAAYARKQKMYRRKLAYLHWNGKLRFPKWLRYAKFNKKKKPIKVLTKKEEEKIRKRPKISLNFKKKVLKNSIFEKLLQSVMFISKKNTYNFRLHNLRLNVERSIFCKKLFIASLKRILYHNFLKKIILRGAPSKSLKSSRRCISYIFNTPAYLKKDDSSLVSLLKNNTCLKKKKRLVFTATYLRNLSKFYFFNEMQSLLYPPAYPVRKKQIRKRSSFFFVKKFKFNYNYFLNLKNTNYFFSETLNNNVYSFLYGFSPFLRYRITVALQNSRLRVPSFFFFKKEYKALPSFFSKFIYLKNIYANYRKDWPFNNYVFSTTVAKKLKRNQIHLRNLVDINPNFILVDNLCTRSYSRNYTYYDITKNNYVKQFLNEIKFYWNLKKKSKKKIYPNPWLRNTPVKKIKINFLKKKIKFKKIKITTPSVVHLIRRVSATQYNRIRIKEVAKYLVDGPDKKICTWWELNKLNWNYYFKNIWNTYFRRRTTTLYRLRSLYKLVQLKRPLMKPRKIKARRIKARRTIALKINYFRALTDTFNFIKKSNLKFFTSKKKNLTLSLLEQKWIKKILQNKESVKYLFNNSIYGSAPFLTFVTPTHGLKNILKSWHLTLTSLPLNLSFSKKIKLIFFYFFRKLINLLKFNKTSLNFAGLGKSRFLQPMYKTKCYPWLYSNYFNSRIVNKYLHYNFNFIKPFSFYLKNKEIVLNHMYSAKTQRVNAILNLILKSSLIKFFNLNTTLFSSKNLFNKNFFFREKMTRKKKFKHYFYLKNKNNKLNFKNKSIAFTIKKYKFLFKLLQKKLSYFFFLKKFKKKNLKKRNFVLKNLLHTYLFKQIQFLKKLPSSFILFLNKRTALRQRYLKTFFFFFRRRRKFIQRIILGWSNYSHIIGNKRYPWYWIRHKGTDVMRPLRRTNEALTRLMRIKKLRKKIPNKLTFFSKSVGYRNRLVFNNITAGDAHIIKNSTKVRDFFVDLNSKKIVNFINNFRKDSSLSKMHTFLYFWFFSSDAFSLKSEDISMEYDINAEKAYYPASHPVPARNYSSQKFLYSLNWVEFLNKFGISSESYRVTWLKKLRDLTREGGKKYPSTILEELFEDRRSKVADAPNFLKFGLIFRKNLGSPPGVLFTNNRLRIWDLLPKMFQLNKRFSLFISNFSVLNFSKNLSIRLMDSSLHLKKNNLIYSTFFRNALTNSTGFFLYNWTLNALNFAVFRFFYLFVKVYTFFVIFIENTNIFLMKNLLFIFNSSLLNNSLIKKSWLTTRFINKSEGLMGNFSQFSKILNLYLADVRNSTIFFFKEKKSKLFLSVLLKKFNAPTIFYYDLIKYKVIFLLKKFIFNPFELFNLNFYFKSGIPKYLQRTSNFIFKKFSSFTDKFYSFGLKKKKLTHFLKLRDSSWSNAKKKKIRAPAYLYYASTNCYHLNRNPISIKSLYWKLHYNTNKYWGLHNLVKNCNSRQFLLNLNLKNYATFPFLKDFKCYTVPKDLLWNNTKPTENLSLKDSKEALSYLQVNYTKQNCVNYPANIKYALRQASNYFKSNNDLSLKYLYTTYLVLRKFYLFFKKSAIVSEKIFTKLHYTTLKRKVLRVLLLIKRAYKTNNIAIRRYAASFASKLFKDIAVLVPLVKLYALKRVTSIITILEDIILSYRNLIKDTTNKKSAFPKLIKKESVKLATKVTSTINKFKHRKFNAKSSKLKETPTDVPAVPNCIKEIYKDHAYLKRRVKLIPLESITTEELSEEDEKFLNQKRISGPVITLMRILKRIHFLLKKGKSYFIAKGNYCRKLSYRLRITGVAIYKNIDKIMPKHKLIYKEALYPLLRNVPLILKLLRLLSRRSNKIFTLAAILGRPNTYYENDHAFNLLYNAQFLSDSYLYNTAVAKLLKSNVYTFTDFNIKFKKFNIISSIQIKLDIISSYENNPKSLNNSICNLFTHLKSTVNMTSELTSWNFYLYFYKLFCKMYTLFYYLRRLSTVEFKRLVTRFLKLSLKQLFLKLSKFFVLDKIYALYARSIFRKTVIFFTLLLNSFALNFDNLSARHTGISNLIDNINKKTEITAVINNNVTKSASLITFGSNFFFKNKFLYSLKVFFGEFYFYQSKALSPFCAFVWQFFPNTTVDSLPKKVLLDFSYNLLFRVFYTVYHQINRFVKKFSMISEKKAFDYEEQNRDKPAERFIEANKRMHYRHVLRKYLYNYLSSFQANRVINKYKRSLRLPKTSLRFIGPRKQVSALLVWYLNFLNFFTIYRTNSGFFKILRRVFKLFRFLKIFFLRYYLIIFLLQQVFMRKRHWGGRGYTWLKKLFLTMHFFLKTLNKVFKVFLSFVRVMFKNFFSTSLNNIFFTTLKDGLLDFYKEKLIFYSRNCVSILKNSYLTTSYFDFNSLYTTKVVDSFSFFNFDFFICSLNIKNYFVKRLSLASLLPTSIQLNYDFYTLLTGSADNFYFKFLLAIKEKLHLAIRKSFFFKKKMIPYKRRYLLVSPAKLATDEKEIKDFYSLIIPEIIFNLLKNENKFVFRGFENFLVFCLSSRKQMYTTLYQFFYFFDYDTTLETFFDKILPFKSDFTSSMMSIYFSYAAYFKHTSFFINLFDLKSVFTIRNLNFLNYWVTLTRAKNNNKDHINNWAALNKRKRDTGHFFFNSFYFFKHYKALFVTFLRNFYKVKKFLMFTLKQKKIAYTLPFNNKKITKPFASLYTYAYNSTPFIYITKFGNFALTFKFSSLLNYYKSTCVLINASSNSELSRKDFLPTNIHTLLAIERKKKKVFYNEAYSVLTCFYEYTLYHRYNYWKKYFYKNIMKLFELSIIVSSTKFRKFIFSSWSNIFISYSLYFTCIVKRGTFTYKGLNNYNYLYKFANISFFSVFFVLRLNLVYSYFLKRTYFYNYTRLVFLIFWVTRILLFWHNYLYLNSAHKTYNLKIRDSKIFSKASKFTSFFSAGNKYLFRNRNSSFFFFFFRVLLNRRISKLVNSANTLLKNTAKKTNFLFLSSFISVSLNLNICIKRFNPFFFKNIYYLVCSNFFERHNFTLFSTVRVDEASSFKTLKFVSDRGFVATCKEGIHNFYQSTQLANFIKIMYSSNHNLLLNLFINNFRTNLVEKRHLLNSLDCTDDFVFRFKKFSKGPGHLKPVQLYSLKTKKKFKVFKHFVTSYKARLSLLYTKFFLKKKLNFLVFFWSAFAKYKYFTSVYNANNHLSKDYNNFLRRSWINLCFLNKKSTVNTDLCFNNFNVNTSLLVNNFNTFTQHYLLNIARSYGKFRHRAASLRGVDTFFLNNLYRARKEHFISYLYKQNKEMAPLRVRKRNKKNIKKKKIVYNAVEMEFIRRRCLMPFLFPKENKKNFALLRRKRRNKFRHFAKNLSTVPTKCRGRRTFSPLLPIFKKLVKINLDFFKYIYGSFKVARILRRSRYAQVSATYRRITSHSTTLLKRQKFKRFIRKKRAYLAGLSKNFINIKYRNLLKMLKRRFFTFFLNFKKFFFLNFLRVTDKYLSLLLQSKLFSFFNRYSFFYDFFNFFLRIFFKMRWLFFFRYFCFLRLVSTRCSFFLLTFNLKNFFFTKKL